MRQNRCDQEMYVFAVLCFCAYLALQLFSAQSSQAGLVNALNLLLYVLFVPGFLFLEGYSFSRMRELNSEHGVKTYLFRRALFYYLCYLAFAVAQDVIYHKLPVSAGLLNAATAVRIPSCSALFFMLAFVLLLLWIFYGNAVRLLEDQKKWRVVIPVILLCAMLRANTESYAVTAALFGSSASAVPPGVPYFAYFMLGYSFWKKKPGFRLSYALAAAAVSGAALLLYRTPLQNLCRVLISCLPVYLMYVCAEAVSDVTVRVRAFRFACDTVNQVLLVYSLALFIAFGVLGDTNSALRSLLICVGVLAAIYMATAFVFGLSRVYISLMNRLHRVKHKMAVYFLIYTAAFVFLLLLSFGVFWIEGRSFIVGGDGVTQYFPRAVYYIRYMKELLSGLVSGSFEFPMYDFNIGFGSDIIYHTEPLYLLYLLLGEEHVEFTYNLTVLIRFYLSGISCSIFMFYFKKGYFTAFLASIVYVFCGMSFFAGPMHLTFMIPMILLPMLIISIEEIIRCRRWYLCTIFVALSLFCNYYFLYINTIAMGVYFLVRFFCQKDREKKTVKRFFGRGLVISGSYLLGVAMSCFVLVTSFGLYVSSGRNGDIRIKTPSLFYYDEGWLSRCFLNFLTTSNSPGEWMKLGYLPIAMLALVLLFRRKNRKELKILSVIGLCFSVFPLFGFIFSGFSVVINRWCYMLALLIAYIVAECLADLMNLTKKDIIACLAVIGMYGGMILFGQDAEGYTVTGHTKAAFICLVITFLVVLFCQESNTRYSARFKQCVLTVLTAAMVFWQANSYYVISGAVNGYRLSDTTLDLEYDTPLLAISELDDDSFYRSATPKLNYSTSNSPMLIGTKSITMVCSTLNSSIMEYFEKVGNISYSMTQLLGLNNRTFLSSLAAVKYYAYYGETDRKLPCGYEEALTTEVNGEETTVCENNYALPLGYTYSESISEEELEQYEIEERSEVMMQKVVLDSEHAEESGGSEIEITGEQLEILSVEETNVTLSEHALTAALPEGEEETEDTRYRIKFHFEGRPNSETYLVLKNAWTEGDASEEGISLTLTSEGDTSKYTFQADNYRYASGQKDFVINLGYHEEAIDSFRLRMGRAGVIHFDSLEIYSQSMDHLEQYTDALKEDVLEEAETGTNLVSGKISLDEDKILVLSIPYQKGWTAYVDGQETELLRANYMYMALPLEAGAHEIELRFEIPYIYTAFAVMAGSAALFVVLVIIWHIRKRRETAKRK